MTMAKPARTVDDIRRDFTHYAGKKRQAWAETNLLAEGVCTLRIDALLDEYLELTRKAV